MNKSVILLSGGLDSLVALGYSQKHTDLCRASLNF